MQAYFSLCKYISKILNTLNSESLGVCWQSQSPTPTVTATDPPLANSPTMYSKLVHQDWHFCLGVLINGIRQHTERRTLGLVDWLSLAADIRDTSQCVAIVALILQNPKNYLFRAWIAVRFMSAAICFSWRCLRVWIKPVSLLLLFAACCAFLWQKYPFLFSFTSMKLCRPWLAAAILSGVRWSYRRPDQTATLEGKAKIKNTQLSLVSAVFYI